MLLVAWLVQNILIGYELVIHICSSLKMVVGAGMILGLGFSVEIVLLE